MLILGHRGASAERPENTLEAFARAYAVGADGLEFDVRAAADGIPVLAHDRDLQRRAGDPRNVDELPAATLATIDVGDGHAVPTLREAMTLFAGRGFLDVEIKQAGIEAAILTVLADYPEQRWGISSFDWTVLSAVRAQHATCDLWLLAVDSSPALFSTAADLGAAGVALWAQAYTPKVAASLRAAGLETIIWTVNDVAEARRVRDLGAYALCTDDPATLVAALR